VGDSARKTVWLAAGLLAMPLLIACKAARVDRGEDSRPQPAARVVHEEAVLSTNHTTSVATGMVTVAGAEVPNPLVTV
jgi:hypothetical protein